MTHFILIVMLAGAPPVQPFPTKEKCEVRREQYLEVGAKVSTCRER